MTDLEFDVVEEVPPSRTQSKLDPIANHVHKTGDVVRITSTKKRMSSMAQSIKKRYPDLDAVTRTIDDEYFVFVSKRKKGSK